MRPMCSIMAAMAMGAITRMAERSNLAIWRGGRPILVLSKVYDPRVIRLAAVYAVILGFIPKMAGVIGSMPT